MIAPAAAIAQGQAGITGKGNMRPQSITIFERLFFTGLAVSIANFAMTFSSMSEATVAGLSVTTTPLIAGFCIGTAIYLLLWYFIARRASNIARWVLAVVFTIGLVGLPSIIAPPMGQTKLLALAVTVLHLVAIISLFQKSASAWLAGKKSSATLD